jgi:hypothetical protein
VVWDGTSSERSTAGEVLDVALHHPLFGPSVDEISAVHEYLVETYVDPYLTERVKETRDTANEILNTSGVGDVLLATIRVPPWGAGVSTTDELAQMSGALRDAARGKGNFGIGSFTAQEADELGRAWVGENYRVASDGRTLVSHDKLRQYRPPSYKPKLGKVQANLEWRLEESGQWQGNAHVDIIQR